MLRQLSFGIVILVAILATSAVIALAAFPRIDLSSREDLRAYKGTVQLMRDEWGTLFIKMDGQTSYLLYDEKCGAANTLIRSLQETRSPVTLWVDPKTRYLNYGNRAYKRVLAAERGGQVLRSYEQCEASWVLQNQFTALSALPFALLLWYGVWRLARQMPA